MLCLYDYLFIHKVRSSPMAKIGSKERILWSHTITLTSTTTSSFKTSITRVRKIWHLISPFLYETANAVKSWPKIMLQSLHSIFQLFLKRALRDSCWLKHSCHASQLSLKLSGYTISALLAVCYLIYQHICNVKLYQYRLQVK